MFTNELKKGAVVRLRNGWYAVVYDNMKGNTRMCKVFGYETEIGSVYSHDIAAHYPEATEDTLRLTGSVQYGAKASAIQHTPAQIKLRAMFR